MLHLFNIFQSNIEKQPSVLYSIICDCRILLNKPYTEREALSKEYLSHCKTAIR